MGFTDIQRRRRKKLSQLQKLKGVSNPRKMVFNGDLEIKFKNRFYIQSLSSFLLFIGILLIFQVNHPYALSVKNFVKESLTREYNFDGLYNWYEEKFDGYPAILPSFELKYKDEQNSLSFASPINTAPVTTRQNEFGVYLTTDSSQAIVSVGRGQVIYAGQNGEHGKMVIIRHPNGIESSYSMLTTADVKKDDWVEQGQIIGSVEEILYFSIKDQEEYFNPLEVIMFD